MEKWIGGGFHFFDVWFGVGVLLCFFFVVGSGGGVWAGGRGQGRGRESGDSVKERLSEGRERDGHWR